MVMIYQFKAIKENNLTMVDQVIMERRILLLNPSYHEMMWPHQVKLSCKHSIMLVQALLEGYDFSIQGYP
ncbi:hypothetical protein H5410_062687 [Solanum commersonii]|uniref:Uncharacterized protein n=1 Tax=Solanum commersonii TaxID=4109 RepID=A0A9J5WBC1_SOLCO|nr:hypothetical protein H5410_062687 [Solanum commersonii]